MNLIEAMQLYPAGVWSPSYPFTIYRFDAHGSGEGRTFYGTWSRWNPHRDDFARDDWRPLCLYAELLDAQGAYRAKHGGK